MEEKKQKEQQLQLTLDPAIAKGAYANIPLVANTPAEFILDFFSFLPGMPSAQQISRIILSPENAKRLALVLNDSVVRYEKTIGKITLDQPQAAPAGPRTADPFGTNGEA